jgi:hypothetical protein
VYKRRRSPPVIKFKGVNPGVRRGAQANPPGALIATIPSASTVSLAPPLCLANADTARESRPLHACERRRSPAHLATLCCCLPCHHGTLIISPHHAAPAAPPHLGHAALPQPRRWRGWWQPTLCGQPGETGCCCAHEQQRHKQQQHTQQLHSSWWPRVSQPRRAAADRCPASHPRRSQRRAAADRSGLPGFVRAGGAS